MKKPEVIYRVHSNKPATCVLPLGDGDIPDSEVTSQVCAKCDGHTFLKDRRVDCDLCNATGYAPPYKNAMWKDAQKNAKA